MSVRRPGSPRPTARATGPDLRPPGTGPSSTAAYVAARRPSAGPLDPGGSAPAVRPRPETPRRSGTPSRCGRRSRPSLGQSHRSTTPPPSASRQHLMENAEVRHGYRALDSGLPALPPELGHRVRPRPHVRRSGYAQDRRPAAPAAAPPARSVFLWLGGPIGAMRAALYAVLLAGLAAGAAPAMGDRLEAYMDPGAYASPFRTTHQMAAFIVYTPDGTISGMLDGADRTLTVRAGPENPGVRQLMADLNDKICSDGGQTSVNDLVLEYTFRLVGGNSAASMHFEAVLTGNLTGYVILPGPAGSAKFSPISPSWTGGGERRHGRDRDRLRLGGPRLGRARGDRRRRRQHATERAARPRAGRVRSDAGHGGRRNAVGAADKGGLLVGQHGRRRGVAVTRLRWRRAGGIRAPAGRVVES